MSDAAISFVDRPFAPPLDIELDLPIPPSVNRIWQHAKAGKSRVSRSEEYAEWTRQADKLVGAMAQLRGIKPIKGKFEAVIILDRVANGKGDADNRIKALLDYAERCMLIDNDRHLEELRLCFGTAPHGCRLILRPREPN